jgi:hypothetical protein
MSGMTGVARAALAGAACTALLVLGGCGGGNGAGGGGTSAAVENTQAVVVDAGPVNVINFPFVTVTVCVPGNVTACQSIDHIQVDTGSSGLRLLSSVLSPALSSLPKVSDAAGNPIVECMQFVDGFSWGPVKRADLSIGGEKASSVPVQVIGDPAYSAIPSTCANTGPPENNVAQFGANGLIGLSVFLQDCGAYCAGHSDAGLYYACPTSGTCIPATVAVGDQVANPAAMFATDNNGVIIALPFAPASGAATVAGTLIFGVGTQANNGLGGATMLGVDPTTGNLQTVWNGHVYSGSYVDSGSSAIYFGINDLPPCTGAAVGLYCPTSTQTLTASIRGMAGSSSTVTFAVANADQLLSGDPRLVAFPDLAGPASDAATFDWGLPFFYGRRVYTVFEGMATPAGPGPYVAF